ncbi:transmembrane protein 203-like [Octodon degus]|uniref:Transmembrane protein 203-like n=1 Tax=Octodon degus TaxID=10160 RepID=A0A6P3V8Y5_OCTDE|nr:transmembrane protein 203-like [Octodon degus]
MLFSLRELVQWLGFATFEIFVHLLALSVFSVLLALRVDGLAPGPSWWNVFVPFFAADGLSTYFTTIVSVRLFQDGEKRPAVQPPKQARTKMHVNAFRIEKHRLCSRTWSS